MKTLIVNSKMREEMIEITREVSAQIRADGEGICVLFVQHTTCGLTINENADPDVPKDMLGFLRALVPQDYADFRHVERNSDAHIKSTFTGVSLNVPFENCALLLGQWQGIFLCEFDGARERKVLMKII